MVSFDRPQSADVYRYSLRNARALSEGDGAGLPPEGCRIRGRSPSASAALSRLRLTMRYLRFRVRLRSASSPVLIWAYSVADRVPESFSLSMAKSSSLRALRRIALLVAGGAVGAACGRVDCGKGRGSSATSSAGVWLESFRVSFPQEVARAAIKNKVSAPRIHHLYFVSGSGSRWGRRCLRPACRHCLRPSRPAACGPMPAPWVSAGIWPSPETVNEIAWPG